MDSESIRWTAQSALEWMQTLLTEDQEEPVDQTRRQELLRICSVMAQFRTDRLQGHKGALSEEDIRAALRNDLVTLPRIPQEEQWFTLKPESRVEGLRQLQTLEQMRAERQLNVVDHPTVLQQVFDQFLNGNYTASDSDDVQQLEGALKAATWLEPYIGGAITITSLKRRLALRRLLYPMERLTRGFMGRTSELAKLRRFVGVLDPQSHIEAVVGFLSSYRATRNPLMLFGIGGIGKSTLLAEFIRQHLNSPVPFPWAYLDFDNPRLNVAVLSTLIEEAVEQLSAQYVGSDWGELLSQTRKQSLLAEGASYQSEDVHRSLVLDDVKFSDELRERNARETARSFAQCVRLAMESSELERMMHSAELLPLLIVIDTFEEVQKRGVEMAAGLWQFLSALQREFPRVRIIISGRAPVPELATYLATADPLPLTEFDQGSAISFLMAHEVSSPDAALALYRQVGGNPLNLKLAAQVAKLENSGKGTIEGLKTSSYLIFAAAEHVVQGQLYRRILDRISDQDLRKLAHPGLVVRRITKEIIQKVLAGPCGLGEIDDQRAQELFAELKKQVDLVTIEPDGVLRHQQDIRRVMLKMLEGERPTQVRQIHEGAYEFYRATSGTPAQIEKIYHALQLGKEESEIRAMWLTDAIESMLSSVDELPPSSQLIVYVLAKSDPPQELRALASLEQWERVVEAKARPALQYGQYTLVQQLLEERPDRTPGSALYAIGALACMSEGNRELARVQLDMGIESAQSVNRIDRLVELLRLRGELLGQEQRDTEADAAMAEAQRLAMRMGVPVLALQIYVGRVRLSTQGRGTSPPIPELDEIVKATGDADFASVRVQLRGLFRGCGSKSILLLEKGLRVFKLRYVTHLAHFPDSFEEPLKRINANRLNEFFQGQLARAPEDMQMRAAIADILEEALDPSRSARSA
jgi:hypothetical protein